ncbi:VQ motif-containing protein [Perilla frutescens var. hirtella]|uniref:VQ motif-containing protein n=1 Tax=Perilla frutescens var. hirtella TaxID=608512 RepID=A0AAD4JLK8_PERFH|nr:VQ motif-containing protein [Perilla frutescens var. hirtella]KAH6835549.1 VQ motif-containing protein [Perilla frutescens var. hirtella]
MEITSSSSRPPERENPSPTNSPHSNGSSTSSSNGSSLHLTPTPPLTPTPKPSISRSHDTNPYPTTFVQADTTTFKQVVQMLTGSSDTAKHATKPDPPAASRGGIPPIKSTGQKKQGFKLYERRNSLKNGLMINTYIPGLAQSPAFSPRKPEILSPSILDFPSLVLSPVTPMNEDTLSLSKAASAAADQEEKAIAEKKFYFHPSPRTTPKDATPPQLLPLFPVTSPRVSGSSS